MARRIILALDSFKGCIASQPLAEYIARVLEAEHSDLTCDIVPIADGGEGLTEALHHRAESRVTAMVSDPLMRPTEASYLVADGGTTAILEMASAAGLPLLCSDERNPLYTTTYGVGELIVHALEHGCRHFLVGIGGSATNDAGTGMLSTLGFRFLDREGRKLMGIGANLEQIARIDTQHLHPLLCEASFEVACDVNNPLFGKHGAAYVYAPQKGADPTMVERLDNGLRNFAEVVYHFNGERIGPMPGAGAAGGLGGAMAALLGAQLRPGIDVVLDQAEFDRKIEGATLIVTGEGRMDRQTLMGKAPYGVMLRGQRHGIPVVALAGRIDDRQQLLDAGFAALLEISPRTLPLEEAMRPPVALKNIGDAIRTPEFTYFLT